MTVLAAPGRTLVMGIVNVTPDSFSDGGEWLSPGSAVSHARQLIADGADIIDIGGESTRPGATRPSVDEELRRVVPVIEALAADGVRISVDTMRAEVARAAVEAGASIVNDVSGGLADPDMLAEVARLGVEYVTMHWRGHGDCMNDLAHYDDVAHEVLTELTRSIQAALDAGIRADRLIIDPGIGFSKLGDHDWEVLRHLGEFQELGYRVLVGVSRKRFLGALLDGREAKGRDAATAAITALCAERGIWAVRTHEVKGNADAVRVVATFMQY